jgi:formate--tetrahydrofolate ligase
MYTIMKTDAAIAQKAHLESIYDIGNKIGIQSSELIPWGNYKAKVSLDMLQRVKDKKPGKLILVTTINPTSGGEGKTTVTIGLAQALARLGKKVTLAIRQPSLGPIMGLKGGATGGGYSQVVPRDEINLHFTGDMHAVTLAHNLLSALLDNHIFHGDAFHIDPRYIVWPRVLDVNDRNLRNVVVGLGGALDGIPHQESFAITAASEVMAILCLSLSRDELKERLGRIITAYTYDDKPVTAKDLRAVGAMAVLLKDAILPNLVQTIEGVPAFIHGGPFANIAHGTSSLIAASMGLRMADYFITEAGFGTDLGAEKFFNIVCRRGLTPDAAVLVVSLRALMRHGGFGVHDKPGETGEYIKQGLCNLEKHLENVALFGVPVIVAINRFHGDKAEDIAIVEDFCQTRNVPLAVVDVYGEGGEGGIELAGKIVDLVYNSSSRFKYLYNLNEPVKQKIGIIAKKIYGADRVVYTVTAEDDLRIISELGLDDLPICMAKTPYSLSDNPALVGRPTGFKITIKTIRISAGAGFLVPITGKITTMPGLPGKPQAERMDIDESGRITGLF